MLWRGSARLGGVSGVDFNVLGNPAELVRKLKVNAEFLRDFLQWLLLPLIFTSLQSIVIYLLADSKVY